jgi:hypothetical protein
MILDPVIHGVAGHQPRLRHRLAHAPLQDWIDVGQKEKLRVAIGVGNLRLEGGKDIQIGDVRLGLVQAVEIGALPEEALACGVLDAAGVDFMRIEDRFLSSAEVFADDGDDAHIAKVARGERKIRRRAAQAALPASRRSFNRIEGHAAHYGNRHLASSLTQLR